VADRPRRITLEDLLSPFAPNEDTTMKSIVVRRGTSSKEYSVPVEDANKRAADLGKNIPSIE
jgi:hypothetical protein